MMPDKIFVGTDPFGFMHAYYIENHPPYGEEYIRKDALLEWLKEVKADPMIPMNIDRVIEKINAL